MDETDIRLTEEQLTIIDLAKKGHNICILGRAGVGKSTTVEELHKIFSAEGKNCKIVCSTGIACENYDGVATTVHSYYGLQVAELPLQMFVERSMKQVHIQKRVSETSVLIWDEVSMSSKRIFEIIYRIHHFIAGNNFAFGGIQVILVGDFWQLDPIPSIFDEGKSMYESQLFNKAFQHRIELTKVLRQSESDERLKALLDMIRVGECSNEAEEYVRSLNRQLKDEGVLPTHIYFKKIQVEFHNGTVLADIPGELITCESIDTGNAGCLEKTIPKSLVLKPGCRIMCLYNINDNLKNGYQGKFIGKDPADESKLLVHFGKIGTISISRRTWLKYGINGKVQGSRTQFPITPSYAITVHKSQSLTLDAVVVHCSQEFVHGQTYVAISRVKSAEKLQVINFQRKFLLPLPVKLSDLATTTFVEPDESYTCCRNRPLDNIHFVSHDRVTMEPIRDEEPNEFNNNEDVTCVDDELTERQEYFESADDAETVLEDALLCAMPCYETELSTPPSTFKLETFLASATTNLDDPYSQSINSAASYASNNMRAFQILSNILWCRIVTLFKQHLADKDEINLTNKDIVSATSQIHRLFLLDEYKNDLTVAFGVDNWEKITNGQRSLIAQLTLHLYQIFMVEAEKEN